MSQQQGQVNLETYWFSLRFLSIIAMLFPKLLCTYFAFPLPINFPSLSFSMQQRNSHWRVQSFTSHSPAIKNGTGPPSTYSGKIDDSNITITPTILTTAQNPLESNPMMPLEPNIPSSECPISDQQEQTVEGGTISISSVYSETLLNTLTQALQTSGLDLSQASISVQIDLGKRANRKLVSGTSTGKDHDASSGEDSDHQAQKRMKTSS